MPRVSCQSPSPKGRGSNSIPQVSCQTPYLQTIVLDMGRDDGMDAMNGNYWLGPSPTLASHVVTPWPVDYAERTGEENIIWQAEAIRKQTP